MQYYSLKTQGNLCYAHVMGKQRRFTYSQQVIDFIVGEIRKDPTEIVDKIKNKKNKSTPGAKEF